MARPHNPSRRQFIKTLTAGTVIIGYGSLLGCGDGEGDGAFLHGVASGDPLADGVVLWTRLTPPSNDDCKVEWEVAEDEAFTAIVNAGSMVTNAARDYTVKADTSGLAPATRYYYRFFSGNTASPVGITRTLPAGNTAQTKLAVVCCANYPAGYFNVYREIANQSDFDAVIGLGNYIYEYGADGYASENAANLGRRSQPGHELITLDDYRTRYAQYRSDPDLQEMHRKIPFVAVWDDHEIANDAHSSGAANHDPASEGDFFARRDAAIKAFYEWMPIREVDPNSPERIYRSFDFGDLLSLHMLDTRIIGRDKQLDYSDYIDATSGAFDETRFTADLTDPNRQLIGAEQQLWLQNQLAASQSQWQILGQQILMGRMDAPVPVVTGAISFSDYADLVVRAQISPGSLTAEEQAILARPFTPYNMDAWDGYFGAREAVLGAALAGDKNLIVLSGDTHNAWANNLKDINGNQVGVEFATSSVSSPGLEAFLPNENPDVVAAGLVQLVGPLQYANTENRGHMSLTVTQTEAVATWNFVDTVSSRTYSVLAGKRKSLKVRPDARNQRIEAV